MTLNQFYLSGIWNEGCHGMVFFLPQNKLDIAVLLLNETAFRRWFIAFWFSGG